MKAYTVTEDQLENLGLLQFSSTASFSVAASLATFWIGVRQDIAFSGATDTAASAEWWNGLATGALILAIALTIVGAMLARKGATTVGKIKRETVHD